MSRAVRLLLPALLVLALLPAAANGADDHAPSARARAAYAALLAGDAARALRESERAAAEQPDRAGVWSVRGYVLSQSGN